MKKAILGFVILFIFVGIYLFVLNMKASESEQINKTKIPVLMYHILIEDKNDTISIDPDRFKEQMLALKQAGYNTITEFDLHNHFEKGVSLPEKPILITFDDGYISNYTDAYPILKELNMKATIYVIGSRIFEDKKVVHGELEKITWKHANEMAGTMTIQSHTWDSHKKVKSISGKDRGMIASRLYLDGKLESQEEFENRVYQDFVKSRQVIKDKLGYDSIAITYPYGDYSDTTMKIAEKAGYKMAFTVKKGLISYSDKRFALNRITADGAYSGEKLLDVIERY